MKKFLTLVLGFALLAGSIIPFSSASRDAYHAYLYQKARQRTIAKYPAPKNYRPFSERKGSTKQLLQVRRGPHTPGSNPTQNLRYSLHDTRNAFSTEAGSYQPKRTVRPSTRRIYSAFQENYNRQGPLQFRRAYDAVTEFRTFKNDTFSFQIPKGWDFSKLEDGKYTFDSRHDDFVISIQRLESECQNVNFTACAINTSKAINHENPAEKIITGSSVERKSHFSTTVLDSHIQTRTMTESFVGESRDGAHFIARYFVADLHNGMYVIETTTSLNRASGFVGVSKRIFDSFRLFGN